MPKVIAKTANMDRWEWLENRTKGIGGSDAATIAGVNPYKSPIVLYMEKTGKYTPPVAGEAASWGNILEPVIRQEFIKRINAERDEQGRPHVKVQQRHALFSHSEHDFMRANVDGIITCPELGKGILEIKTANQFMSDDWAGDDVPNQYYIQLQHYLEVMDMDYGYMAVLIGGQRYKHYYIERDKEFSKALIELERNFWFNNVLADIPPEIDGKDSTVEMMKLMYPQSYDEPIVYLPDETVLLLEGLEEAKKHTETWKEEKQKFENMIKDLMKEQAEAWAGPHKITWKANKNGVKSFKVKMNAKKGVNV